MQLVALVVALGVASASLSPIERLHWEKHNSPLPPDPPPVTAPTAAAPVAAVAAHFEPETKVATSAPKRATPAVAAPAAAARPHAGVAAVDAAAALAAAHATVFTTTALTDAVAAANAPLRFKASGPALLPSGGEGVSDFKALRGPAFKALRGAATPAGTRGATSEGEEDTGEGNSSADPVKADIFGNSFAELASTPDREAALPPPKESSRPSGGAAGDKGWLGGATPREEGTQELSNLWNNGAGKKGLKVSSSAAAAVKAAADAAKNAPRFASKVPADVHEPGCTGIRPDLPGCPPGSRPAAAQGVPAVPATAP